MSPSSMMLAGRYRLEDPIAAGGVGEVWRSTDLVLGRPVAVKLLRSEYAGHPETLARFRAEARHAGSLSNPGIAQIYDYGETDLPGSPYLVMELVDGPSLSVVLAAGPLDPAHAMDVIAQTAAGLAAAHAVGLIHRDIKPANLVLTPGGQVKITDFGIAHVAGSAPMTRTGTVVGTPAYLAPERAGGAPATPASDLYSLGVVGHECLTGVAPFRGTPMEVTAAHRHQPLPPLPPGVPAGIARLVAELTAKDPAARPASAAMVAARAARLRDEIAGASPTLPGPAGHAPAAAGPGPHAGPAHAPAAPAHAPATAAPTPHAGPGHGPAAPTPHTGPGHGPAAPTPHTGPGHGPVGGSLTATEPVPARPGVPGADPAAPGSPAAGAWRTDPETVTLLDMQPPGGPAHGPGRRDRPWTGGRVALVLAAGVLIAGLAGWFLANLSGAGGPQLPSATATTQASATASGTVTVNSTQLAGQPVWTVSQQLRQLGLRPRIVWADGGHTAPGTVISVAPAGQVPAGSTVVVTAARHHGHGHGQGNQDGNGGG